MKVHGSKEEQGDASQGGFGARNANVKEKLMAMKEKLILWDSQLEQITPSSNVLTLGLKSEKIGEYLK